MTLYLALYQLSSFQYQVCITPATSYHSPTSLFSSFSIIILLVRIIVHFRINEVFRRYPHSPGSHQKSQSVSELIISLLEDILLKFIDDKKIFRCKPPPGGVNIGACCHSWKPHLEKNTPVTCLMSGLGGGENKTTLYKHIIWIQTILASNLNRSTTSFGE